ncbi:MAG TPA: helix-turn-helix transcriptional regulator [Lacipirellulaceae bacterium]|jgi:transcriptional regulator with XRE-family HTH domain|nr:helix-turn-helix transcriptional regulator [Lacipirellulaceae bacterium]
MAADILEILRKRRKELDLSFALLAERSGVAIATLKRMFNDGEGASLQNVCVVAQAMGVSINGQPTDASADFLEKAAMEKARKLVSMVQATSALESQAVAQGAIAAMIKQTVHELMAGPTRRIWA